MIIGGQNQLVIIMEMNEEAADRRPSARPRECGPGGNFPSPAASIERNQIYHHEKGVQPMKAKKIAALVLALVMLLSLSACGMDLKLTTAVLKLSKVQSVHMDVDGAMELSAVSPSLGLNESVTASVTGGVDFVRDPLDVSADLTVDAVDEQLHILATLKEENGSAVLRYSLDGGYSWESEDLGAISASKEIDPIELLENLGEVDDLVGDFIAVGSETVLGSEATRYDSSISGAVVAAILEETGAEDAIQDNLGTDVNIDFSSLKDVKLSVWVDKASGMPVKGSIDMADMVQSILDSALGEILAEEGITEAQMADVSILLSQMYLSVTLSNFDSTGAIKEPNTGALFGTTLQKSPLQVGSLWRGTIDLSGHSGKGDLENGVYEVWGTIDEAGDRIFFEIYDYESDEAMDVNGDLSPILSFWAEIDGNRIVPVIGDEDAWLINIYLDKSDTEELTFVFADGELTASYFYYDGDASEACDLAFALHPVD